MTTEALKRGFDLLLSIWPRQYVSQAQAEAGMMAYAAALADINDRAWLDACAAAVRSCRFFPAPVELIELAETCAETAYRERIAMAEQARIDRAEAHGQRLLASGVLTEDQRRERRQGIASGIRRAELRQLTSGRQEHADAG